MAVQVPSMNGPTREAIDSLAAAIGVSLPESYLTFAAKHDGATPAGNCFSVGADNESGVRSFISVAEAAELLVEIDGFPAKVVPLAEDGCGNYVYIDPQTCEVFFWDHELEGSDLKLAANLQEFLEALAPVDGNSSQLKPGQVKYAWIDPSFTPEF